MRRTIAFILVGLCLGCLVEAGVNHTPFSKLKVLRKSADKEKSGDDSKTQLKYNEEIDLLMTAIDEEDVERVGWLLQNSVSPNGLSKDGRSPLHEAIHQDNKDMVQILLDHGADINAESKGYMHGHPLLMAIFRNRTDIFYQLLPRYEDLDFEYRGWSPLTTAGWYGNEKFTERLLIRGANPNYAPSEGETALHKAACFDDEGHQLIARLLLYAGADPLSKDDSGYTPIEMAKIIGSEAMGSLLEKAT